MALKLFAQCCKNYSLYRKKDLQKKLQQAGYQSVNILIVGATGAGKSKTLNTLLRQEPASIGGGVCPETMGFHSYNLNDCLCFWDTPGLGNNKEKDKKHLPKLKSLLNENSSNGYKLIDMVLVVLDASSKDLGTTCFLIDEVISPSSIEPKRVFIALNQADFAMKGGRNWYYRKKRPNKVLSAFLDKKAASVQQRVKRDTGLEILFTCLLFC